MSVYDRSEPWESLQERLVTNALIESQAPADELRLIRPRTATTPLFPPRFGFMKEPITIDQVVMSDRRQSGLTGIVRTDFSQSQGGYGASSSPHGNVF